MVCSQLLSPVAFGYVWHSLRCLCTLASRRHLPYVDRMLICETVCRVRFSWSVPALDQFGAGLRAQAFFALAKRDGSSCTREQLLAHVDCVKSGLDFFRGTTSHRVPFDALSHLGLHRALYFKQGLPGRCMQCMMEKKSA